MSVTIYHVTWCHLRWMNLYTVKTVRTSCLTNVMEHWKMRGSMPLLGVLHRVPLINIYIFKWMQLLPIGLQVVQHGTMRCNLMVTVIIIIIPLNIRSSWSVNHPFAECLFKHVILFITELSCHVRTMIIWDGLFLLELSFIAHW